MKDDGLVHRVPQKLAAYARRQWQRHSVQMWVNQKRPPL